MLNRIYTIGHSTRSPEEFVALLREHGVTRLADIRRYPGSRRYPHFAGESLQQTLPQHGIEYVHFPELGGRRKPLRNSPNRAWENEQFRGYADHMATAEFAHAVEALLASERDTAYMCAEAVPWRCHRNLLSDELVRRGIDVTHILAPGKAQKHVLNKMARIDGDRVVYPPEQG
ncbi:MAG: DUF488 domain-containing protein, partial [Acidobacteriota bacterium]|nr:DUF488 domain-containing protein [Acidobacteriota bacterium]